MRPDKLIISAFGPYAEEVNIDFNMLGDKGVYLISGNTGAGKSTIFDAIRFALYADESSEVRSKYAADTTPTYVELSFILREKKYSIKRNPKYMRPKNRGEGYTEAKADAVMTLPDGKIVTGYATVTDKVTELLGLNGEQFSKIVMIAQGKFRELLVADTGSRSKIFRDIFKTSSYDVLQRKIKSRFLEINREYTKVNDSIMQYVKGICLPEEAIEISRIGEIMNQDMVADVPEVIELLGRIINEDEKLLSDRKEKHEKSHKYISDKTGELIKLTSLKDMLGHLMDEYKRMQKYKMLDDEVNGAYEMENNLIPERDKLLVDIEKQRQAVNKYQIYDDKCKEMELCKNKEALKKDDYKKLIDDKEKSEDKLKELEEWQQKTEGTEGKLAEIEGKIKENNLKIKGFERIIKLDKLYLGSVKHYEKMTSAYMEKRKEEDEARAIYDVTLKGFLDAQAGIMADVLRDNPKLPCPVCGATNHIKLAECTDKNVSEEQVKKAKEKWDKSNALLAQSSKEAGVAKTDLDNNINMLKGAINELGYVWGLEECSNMAGSSLALCIEDKKSIERDKEYLEELLIKRKQTSDTILKLKDDNKCLELKIKEAEELIHKYQLMLKELQIQTEALKEELIYDDGIEARKQLALMEDTYNRMYEKYKAVTERKEAHEKDKAACEAVIEQIAKQAEELYVSTFGELQGVRFEEEIFHIYDKVNEAINDETIQLENIKTEAANLADINNKIYARVNGNAQILKNLHNMNKRLEKNVNRLEEIKILSDTLNGEVEGKDKIKLETFVQISYFEQVIIKANTKLFEMTEGQYEFVRDVMGEDKRSKSGLELGVYDHYNGTVRSVKTLSGGESFMASLSLALGMADIIEESASGISIDTMFIDEGFGSLDEAALEQAMKVLSKLSEGDKLVGIISHVGSLRDRIERQINVVKEYTGGSKVIVNV